MQSGSKTVMIKDQEVMLKDQSFFKTAPLGDEAATDGLGAGVTTHVITGKTYFVAWSMDVQFEGANVDRHTDFTTSNHASPMANEAVPTNHLSEGAQGTEKKAKCECCDGDAHSAAQARGESITEEEYYNPKQTGLRQVSVKPSVDPSGKAMRNTPLSPNQQKQVETAQSVIAQTRAGKCKEQLPNNPPAGPCDKYYRVTAKESSDARKKYDEAQIPRAPGAEMIGHRVPLAGGGCPVGPKNLAHVMSAECADWDKNVLGKSQNEVAEIARDKFPKPK
jgi:hypothetical protein